MPLLSENHFIPYVCTRLSAEKILVLAPHPDDETFGCGGTLKLHSNRGEHVKIIFLTDGSEGSSQDNKPLDYVSLRRREAISACTILGVKDLNFWPFKDRALVDCPKVIPELLNVLNSFRPDLIYLPSPLEIHPDHRATAFLFEKALKRSDIETRIALYEIGQPMIFVNTLVDISAVYDAKRNSIEKYTSQLKEQPYDRISESLSHFRSLTLPGSVKHSEAFFLCRSGIIRSVGIMKLFLKQFDYLQQDAACPPPLPQVGKGEWDKSECNTLSSHGEPLVSVIIPTFNRPQLLRRALHSILNQTFQNYEVIVVNDCGEDVREIVECLSLPNRLFRYETHEENKGVAAARNTGIRLAKGHFIAYLDDDDLYFPDHLENIVSILSEGEYQVVYTGSCERIMRNNEFIGERISYNTPFDKEKLFTINYIPTPCVAHTVTVLKTVGYFDESLRSHEDWDMWIRISRKYDFCHLDRLTVAWTHHLIDTGKNLSHSEDFEKSFEQIHQRYPHFWFNDSLRIRNKMAANVRANLKAYFDDISNVLDLRERYYRKHVYQFLGPFSKGKTVLDLFCKDGSGTFFLSEYAEKIVGLDSQENIQKANAVFFKKNLRFHEIKNGAEGILEEGETKFELIIWLNCDSRQIKDKIQIIKNMLTEDGVFVISLSSFSSGNGCSPLSAYKELSIFSKDLFLHSAVWGQQIYPSSYIFSLPKENEIPQQVNIENFTEDIPAEKGKPEFYSIIGVFSDSQIPITQLGYSFLIDRSSAYFENQANAIRDLQGEIRRMDAFSVKLVQEKDQHINNLERNIAGKIEHFGMSIQKKDQHIQNLESLLQNKNSFIEQALQEKDQHIHNLEASIRDLGDVEKQIRRKNNHIQNLENTIQEKQKYIEEKELTYDKKIQDLTRANDDFGIKLNSHKQLIENLNQQIIDKDIHIINRENELKLIKDSMVWRSAEAFRNLFYNKLLGKTPVLKKVVMTLRFEGVRSLLKKTCVFLKHNHLVYIFQKEKSEYEKWIEKRKPTSKAIAFMAKESRSFHYQPKISLVMPVFNVDKKWLKRAIKSVQKQVYPHWELCIADDASSHTYIRPFLERFANKDQRIKVVFLSSNKGISGASNEALSLATGEFIGLLDNDDELSIDALYKCVRLLNDNPEATFIYTDEDKIELDGRRTDPYFKPDFSLDLLLSMNYLCHFCLIRTSIIKEIGGFRKGFEGSQDHDLFLRVVEKVDINSIFHIPEILYHWRKIPGSAAMVVDAKSYAFLSAKKALKDYLRRNNIEGDVFDGLFIGSYRVRRKIVNASKVSIIVPFRDQVRLLEKCLTSIWENTTYPNFEVILVNNRSHKRETFEYIDKIKSHEGVRILEYDNPFNFSAINNFAVDRVDSEFILLLNNDVKVISREWLRALVEHIQRDEVGVVGAKLLYPNNMIQHAGVVMGIGVASHAFSGFPADSNGYAGFVNTIRNYSAVTGACLLTRRDLYQKLGGLDEERFSVAYNDVDFCLKALTAGYKIVYTPYAVLYHYESASRGHDNNPYIQTDDPDRFYRIMAEREFMMEKWEEFIQNDPYYNPNLTRKRNDFSLESEE